MINTIEERAYNQYAGDSCPRDCEKCEMRTDCMDVDYVQAFIDGAHSEHDELTRWHDPKEELPEDGHIVLLKTTFGKEYHLAEHEGRNWWRPYDDDWEISDDQVVGWREIHE